MVCSVCYSEVIKKPKKLTCGHTFCNECITSWLNVSPGHNCPECRTVIEIPVRPVSSAIVFRIPIPTIRIRPVGLPVINNPIRNIYDRFMTWLLYSCVLLSTCIGMALVFGIFYLIGWLFAPRTGFADNNNPGVKNVADVGICILIGITISTIFGCIVGSICTQPN